jgi:hypothetical protein
MPQVRPEPDQSEDLRGLYRTLGLSEQTLECAIKAGQHRRHSRQNTTLGSPAPKVKRRTVKRKQS